MRLKAVEKHLAGEEVFLANYSDGLSDVHLPSLIEHFEATKSIATFVSVKPRASFHMTVANKEGRVTSIEHIGKMGARINGGFFVLRQEIFSYMQEGDELVEAPFHRLIKNGKLFAYPHDGFWGCMDTAKERMELEDLYGTGHAPWAVWNGKGEN
jgi:glucose-1-phosphate cytidylyltransferase